MHFLDTFESFLKQQFGTHPLPEGAEAVMRPEYERRKADAMARDVRALFRKPCRAGEFRYAVAIEDGADLWLTLVVGRRAPGGDCYVLIPRDSPWNPHASYHRDGAFHHKSYDMKLGNPSPKRQPLQHFKGTEHLGAFYGHGVGTAMCHPAAFTSVLTIPTGILEPLSGCVLVDLIEPGAAPAAHHRVPGLRIVREETYRDLTPWVDVTIAAQEDPNRSGAKS
jgi:hypothetical protein